MSFDFDYDYAEGCGGDCLNCDCAGSCSLAYGLPDEYHDGHEDE